MDIRVIESSLYRISKIEKLGKMERFLKDLEQTTLTIFYNQNTHFDTKFIEERIILNEIKGQLKIVLLYWT